MKTIKTTALALFFLGALAFASCKKDSNYCSTCVVTDNSGNVTKNYGEKCGTSTDVDNYEASCKSDASQLPGTFSCSHK